MKYPLISIVLGLILFYVGLKLFAGGMKELRLGSFQNYIDNPYWAFLGGLICTMLWQSSSLSSTAVISLVFAGTLPLPSAVSAILGCNLGTTLTIHIAGLMLSEGLYYGPTKQIAIFHTGANLLMAASLLPFINPIARFIQKF